MESINITNATEAMLVEQRESLFPHYIIFRILTYLVTTCIFVVNGTIFLAYIIQKIRKPNLAKLSAAGLLVLNLLAADGFVGIVTIIMTITETRYMAATQWICTFRVALSFLALIGSHVALINVALDRYVAIMHTLHYRDWMTVGRSVTMICFGWLVPLMGVVGAIASNSWHPGLVTCEQIDSFRLFLTYVWVPCNVLALVCVIAIQCRVYLWLRRHESMSETANQVLKRYSRKSVQILYQVTTTFIVCWGPFDIVLLVIIFYPSPTLKIIYDTTSNIAHISFLVNPCIYSFKTENIRKPVIDLFADIKKAVICGGKMVAAPAPTATEVKNEADPNNCKYPPNRIFEKTGSRTSATHSTSLDGVGHI